MIATKALRRKLDYRLLRWQARLDGEWADRVLPSAAAIGLFLVLVGLALARARSMDTGLEMARWAQGAWLLTHGHGADVTVGDSHLFAPQGAIGFALVAQGTRLVAAVPYLIVIQAGALAAAVIPIWRLCRVVCSLRAGAAVAAVAAYGLYPPMHELNLADFHPEALALPALLTAAYAGCRHHWWWAAGCSVFAMSMRADLGLAVAAIGVVLMIDTRSRQAPRLVLAGVLWTLVAMLVVQPAFGDGAFVHAEAFAAYGTTLPGIVWGIVSDPIGVLGALVARDNFTALVGLLAPVAFLSVLAPRYLLPIAPVVALLFIADIPVSGPDGVPNMVPAMAFVFLALPFALARLGRRNIERITVDRRLLGALGFAALVFFVQDAPSSPYSRPWDWGGRSLADQALLEAIEAVEPGHRVRAPAGALADLAGRRVVLVTEDAGGVGGRAYAAGVDAVLLDDHVTVELDARAYDELLEAIQGEGFDLVVDRAGVVLLIRSDSG